MTKKQREDLERRQARLAQMGIQIGGNDNDGKQQKKKRVVYVVFERETREFSYPSNTTSITHEIENNF